MFLLSPTFHSFSARLFFPSGSGLPLPAKSDCEFPASNRRYRLDSMNSAAAATSLAKSGVASAASGIVRCTKTRSLDRLARGVTTSKALTQSSLCSQSKVTYQQKSTLAGSRRSMSAVSPPSSYTATSSHGSVGGLSGSTSGDRGRGSSDSGREFLLSVGGLCAASAVAVAVLVTSDSSEDKIGGAGTLTVWCRGRDAAEHVRRGSPSSSASPSAAADTPRVSSDLSLNAHRCSPGVVDPDTTDDYSKRCGSSTSASLNERRGHGLGQQHPADVQALKDLGEMREDSSSAALSALANPGAKAVDCTTRITDVYEFDGDTEQVVGRGSRSVVSSARHRLTGQRVAVKKLSRAETTRVEVNTTTLILLTVVSSMTPLG